MGEVTLETKMIKVGDKVIVVSTESLRNCSVGEVLEVSRIDNPYGLWAKAPHGEDAYVRTKEMMGSSDVIVKPYTETEAERRGAKFGVAGVVKQSGVVVRFISDKNHKNGLGETLWDVVNDDGIVYPVHPADIRLDNEPEFVEWTEAPEHMRYDASRVYCDGEPVKWIAKPEGAFTDVVVVLGDGCLDFSAYNLTVKL